jgi:hypothetical protein
MCAYLSLYSCASWWSATESLSSPLVCNSPTGRRSGGGGWGEREEEEEEELVVMVGIVADKGVVSVTVAVEEGGAVV